MSMNRIGGLSYPADAEFGSGEVGRPSLPRPVERHIRVYREGGFGSIERAAARRLFPVVLRVPAEEGESGHDSIPVFPITVTVAPAAYCVESTGALPVVLTVVFA